VKLTPLDVRKQTFRKSMRGFDPEEVRVFLEMVADEHEQLLQENGMLSERVRHLNQQIEHYHGMERTLQNSLLTAERIGEEARERARLEADTILQDARLRAERILEDSRERLRSLKREVRDVHRQKDLFLQRFQSFLESQIQALHVHDEEMRGIDALDARADALLAEATRPAEEVAPAAAMEADAAEAPDPFPAAREAGLTAEPPRSLRRPRLTSVPGPGPRTEPARTPPPGERNFYPAEESRLSFFDADAESPEEGATR
jgi:cell division initiation protein